MIDTYQLQTWDAVNKKWVTYQEYNTEDDARKDLSYFLENDEFPPGSDVVLVRKRIDDLVKVHIPREGTWGE